ncbi:MAG: hypothetical protein RL701_3390 [Pseudomonadota bacterium]
MLEPSLSHRFILHTNRDRTSDVVKAAEFEVELALMATVPDVYTSYAWNNVFFLLWFGPITRESLETFEKGCKVIRERYPQGVSTVNVMIPGGRSFPTAEARAEFSRIMHEYSGLLACSAVVMRGTGFWASTLGSVVTALSMLAPRQFKLRIFNAFAPAVEWLCGLHEARTQVTLDPAQLMVALQLVEAKGQAMARAKERGRLAA